MRIVISLLLAGLGAALVSSQEAELVPAPYLAPEYTAASDAPASVVMAGSNEPGERLIVTGRVLDGSEPIAGASIFVFQTDAAGRYAPDKSGNDAELNPRLRGLLRTDRQGRYRYETIRPGSYDGNAAHVHYVVKAAGYRARLLDLWFEDDPILVARRAAGEPEIPPGIQNSAYYKASSDVVAIRPVARDASGVWHATRDIRMFKR
jgi:protocatechuate 3,4-dioxygenase beta subunit